MCKVQKNPQDEPDGAAPSGSFWKRIFRCVLNISYNPHKNHERSNPHDLL
nr:MAG TPA: hypothetical protein [Caudoviricetes sp.]